MRRHRRPPRAAWEKTRQRIWQRDQGKCQGPYCEHTAIDSLPLNRAQIDHILAISRGGTNQFSNLRTLCRRCHTLRACKSHQGMIATALRDEVISADWRRLVWE